MTDAATASRTMLLNLATNSWSEDLLATFGIGRELLPKIVPCDSRAGNTKLEAFGAEIPVTGLCVDQHAALFGQRCFQPGEAKATYGTGCFLLVNIGDDHTVRADSLLTLLAWQLGSDQAHALEGGVYSAGAIIEWLKNRDCWRAKLGLRTFSTRLGTAPRFTLSPAFNGLAAPHWDNRVRAGWTGITHATDKSHLVRSAVESIAFRVRDIRDAITSNGMTLDLLKVDGGLGNCQALMQFQADLLDLPLQVSQFPHVTATGVGLMAGLGAGIWRMETLPQLSGDTKIHTPREGSVDSCDEAYRCWSKVRSNWKG